MVTLDPTIPFDEEGPQEYTDHASSSHNTSTMASMMVMMKVSFDEEVSIMVQIPE